MRLPWKAGEAVRLNYEHAPLFGEHNEYVFCELLGISKDEMDSLIDEEALY